MPAAPSVCRCSRSTPRSRWTRSSPFAADAKGRPVAAGLPHRAAFCAPRPARPRRPPRTASPAARAAIEGGFGIECDVRLSRDGVVHVFHDKALRRLCSRPGIFAALDRIEAASLRLVGSGEAPPLLSDLLALCSTTPLLIELKSDTGRAGIARLCAAVARDLRVHRGPVAVMSFDPEVCRWFEAHAPHVLRGMVVSRHHRRGILMHRTKGVEIAGTQGHFVACDVRDLPLAARKRGLPLLCWTVRTDRQRALARRRRAQIIFEG